jgi:tRNA-dihydrouridine synthase
MSLKIGKITLDNNLIAAPMAGFADCAWRILARSFGAGLVFSEMVSAEGLRRNQKKTACYLDNDDLARPFAVQLFGAEPEAFAEAADVLMAMSSPHNMSFPPRVVAQGRLQRESSNVVSPLGSTSLATGRENDKTAFKFDLIDVNAGCPVKKVVKRGAGAALMKTPEKIGDIVGTIRKRYGGPLTVKIRSGWDEKSFNAVAAASIAEAAGADAVIVHPRFQSQQFRGRADWRVIGQVKRAVSIPVIGNGDVASGADIRRMFEETGCDGIMIGRAALGRPWIFGEAPISPSETLPRHDRLPKICHSPTICHSREGGNPAPPNILDIVKLHLRLLAERNSERYAVCMMRKFIPKYLKGTEGHRAFVNEINLARSVGEVLAGIERFEHLEHCGD